MKVKGAKIEEFVNKDVYWLSKWAHQPHLRTSTSESKVAMVDTASDSVDTAFDSVDRTRQNVKIVG